ncbi:1-(5-phosphoribosyl)-5-[(5-phosphoribosylamino)methylideneamino]imidazole-4-carboxamide isomerase [Shouchella lehensis]|uniref:1-(5-phosphoribosyl)-5-[(5-phosphoribosylamino)methylideneamino] imidazole-4-carboxamide isomerase n=2 Tax=Shouchella lehensis TaxID=300825 RepID=A0A060M4X0_9BACI|nr:1-(5-phosphoribosyl)-5-[(5-phosphoribosylamino)methylideneamino]imidazole-4-carboxamide isomerase [Shouchella lehensis]AIC95578.1 1-(5-phosphoribosyl)-5-[(5-phosphoribosylamino)methylideneamino] imidazole-4-carboxamide isomerase [Shouchella lehensis G1]MBG9783714.1 1-(5-phosphoribosyl)-5-[(5-phosphoribosylamino)methylideneamino] imidazole-4-carboxamide isomerase [Shouchella lehensis]TES51332.1 1-(5-phosphoribosyl)-5-[(5-phosphoribosylamino)methylideneamino]imidazole-4-carboxamide isomerase [S
MGMTIYPAIDILNGQCVRLEQGDYEKNTVYSHSPLQTAQSFQDAGAKWVHIVDLDGAKKKKPVNNQLIAEIAAKLTIPVQVGGGIRTEEDIAYYLNLGVKRVILGSVAVNNLAFTKEMVKKYGEAIVIGLDARDGLVATEGWIETSSVQAEELAGTLLDSGVKTIVYTDISKDGMLEGPNIAACEKLANVAGDRAQIIASGGVSQLQDLESIRHTTISGVIVGKALYANRFSLEEAVKVGEETNAN